MTNHTLSIVLAAAFFCACTTTDAASCSDNPNDKAPHAENSQKTQVPDRKVDCRKLEKRGFQSHDERYGDSYANVRATGPVATVNGQQITSREFNRFARTHLSHDSAAQPNSNGPDIENTFGKMLDGDQPKSLLDQLIEAEIMRQAVDEAEILVDKARLEEAFEDYKRERTGKNRSFSTFLENSKRTELQARAEVCRSLQRRQYIEQYDKQITEEIMRAYYKRNPNEFLKRVSATGRRIIINTPEDATEFKLASIRKNARSIASSIRNDEISFAEAARKHSDGPNADDGGRFEDRERSSFPTRVGRIIEAAKPGVISNPIRVESAPPDSTVQFQIIRIDERQEPGNIPFDKAKDSIRRKLEREAKHSPAEFVRNHLNRQATVRPKPGNITSATSN